MHLIANFIYETTATGIILRAMPILLFVLGVFAIAYRFYSAFLAAKVLALDDKNITPAHRLKDGKDYDPTNKWVLFGHHFAAISGAGPLIGPVLAIQYGYAPGLFWLVIGVCLAGAVQDMTVLAGSVRCNGKSLGEMAKQELGPWASYVLSLATVVIVILALAGLGFVVVKALGGEEVKYAEGTSIQVPGMKSYEELLSQELLSKFQSGTEDLGVEFRDKTGKLMKPMDDSMHINLGDQGFLLRFPGSCLITYPGLKTSVKRAEGFKVHVPKVTWKDKDTIILPAGCIEQVPGSSWGLFTIACTIPIALLVGFYMYKLRPGKVLEASILGGVLVITATIAGAWIPGSFLEPWFSLTKTQTIWALCIYGFIASVLPVWMLLCPRDYISSFLKVGTIGLLIIGTLLANPELKHPPINSQFQESGPTFPGSRFPFVFICIMCGAISGFHALVASGTTPKMIDKEKQVRLIGYGSMLMEGVVGVVALIAAAALPVPLYYDINVALADVGKYQPQLVKLYDELGLNSPAAKKQMNVGSNLDHLNLAQVEEMVGGEALRGRTGGAVTLAVSMALIFTQALEWTALPVTEVVKYWYHFAIMFEALFILTTIDAGTRIARFILQDALGKMIPKFSQTNWLPGSILATFLVTLGWGWLVAAGSIQTIWSMFGIANQLLAVAALAVATSMLVNRGKLRYAWLTLLPMLFVTTTTMYAGSILLRRFFDTNGWLNFGLTMFVMTSVGMLLLMAAAHWLKVILNRTR